MWADPAALAVRFPAVGLEELDAVAALPVRVDVKYLLPIPLLAELTERLLPTHAVLEIDGRRAFGYHTTYFDTAELASFRAHVQRRRRRYKCRSREYVDSGLCSFEVKLRGPRGRTVKHRMPYDRSIRDEVSEPALAFLRECVERSYGRRPSTPLRPTLAVAYTRVTLVDRERHERLTCDFDVRFSGSGGSGRLAPGLAIVESKSRRGGATAERELRALGARPVSGCSKYCLGVGFTHPDARGAPLRPLLRRHFEPA